jgi:hypothetical protein
MSEICNSIDCKCPNYTKKQPVLLKMNCVGPERIGLMGLTSLTIKFGYIFHMSHAPGTYRQFLPPLITLTIFRGE